MPRNAVEDWTSGTSPSCGCSCWSCSWWSYLDTGHWRSSTSLSVPGWSGSSTGCQEEISVSFSFSTPSCKFQNCSQTGGNHSGTCSPTVPFPPLWWQKSIFSVALDQTSSCYLLTQPLVWSVDSLSDCRDHWYEDGHHLTLDTNHSFLSKHCKSRKGKESG